MDGDVRGVDFRAEYHAINAATLVMSAPGEETLTVSLDLRATKMRLDYDRLHAEVLHTELGAMLERLQEREGYRV